MIFCRIEHIVCGDFLRHKVISICYAEEYIMQKSFCEFFFKCRMANEIKIMLLGSLIHALVVSVPQDDRTSQCQSRTLPLLYPF